MTNTELLETMNYHLDLSSEELRNYAYDMICKPFFERCQINTIDKQDGQDD